MRIFDDGKGFPPYLLGRIGDPFVRRRRLEPASSERPEYEGMGLGLFIAKTLLERSGAELRFANGSEDPTARFNELGAVVEVIWPRRQLDAQTTNGSASLGENLPIRI